MNTIFYHHSHFSPETLLNQKNDNHWLRVPTSEYGNLANKSPECVLPRRSWIIDIIWERRVLEVNCALPMIHIDKKPLEDKRGFKDKITNCKRHGLVKLGLGMPFPLNFSVCFKEQNAPEVVCYAEGAPS